jgi:transcriptional regulator with XRE-family HTH domain
VAQSVLPENGSLIKRGIKEKGLTQAQFSELVGYEERTVRKWIKNGVYDVRVLTQIASIFDCPVTDLFLK